MSRAARKGGRSMAGKCGLWGRVLQGVGGSCLGGGGFIVDEEGRLLEGYEEECPEERYCGTESQDGAHDCIPDYVRHSAERGGA